MNEFIARNGIIAQNNSTVSGSLTVTAGITGSIFGSASYATTAATASYANDFTVAGVIKPNKGLVYQGGIINVTGGTASWIKLGTIFISSLIYIITKDCFRDYSFENLDY